MKPDATDRRSTAAPKASAPTLQLLVWLGERPRTYRETLDVWKTSCPRLSVWEDALADGLARVVRDRVIVTVAGTELLERGTAP
jgi:hypothetical protein